LRRLDEQHNAKRNASSKGMTCFKLFRSKMEVADRLVYIYTKNCTRDLVGLAVRLSDVVW
jgi:hypothetical protein